VQTKIEKIGDGFGLLLPQELLAACGFGEEVNVTVRDKTLVVAAKEPAHTDWDEAIRGIPQEAIDRDFEALREFRETPNEWDGQGWQWPEAEPDEKV